MKTDIATEDAVRKFCGYQRRAKISRWLNGVVKWLRLAAILVRTLMCFGFASNAAFCLIVKDWPGVAFNMVFSFAVTPLFDKPSN